MKKRCLNCGKDLSHLNKGAKFCEQTCRNAFNYKKRSKKAGAEAGLKGIAPDQLSPIKEPEITKPVIEQKEELLPPTLRNTIWVNADNAPIDTAEEEKTEQVPETEPLQFLEKISEAPNPEHKKYLTLLGDEKQKKTLLANQIKALQAEIKQQEGRNGNDIIIVGLIAGSALGLISSRDEKTQKDEMILLDQHGEKLGIYSKSGKRKKKRVNKGLWYTKLGNIFLGAVIGTGLGYFGKKLTEKQREADKQKKIFLIKQKIDSLKTDLHISDFWIEQHESDLKKQPPLLTIVNKIPNPAYEAYIKHQKQNASQSGDKLGAGVSEEGFVPKSKKIISAKDFGNEPMQVLNFQGSWQEFFYQPSTNFHCLIHGNPGEGKSTFCLWFARYLAQNFGRVVYVSGEEGRNSTFQNKLKFCEAQVEGLYISDIRTGEEFLQEVAPNEFNFVIFDSLHDMDIKSALIREIFEKFPNTGIIAIEQNNKSGDIYGTNAMKHTFDIVVNVVNYTAETTKNRFKQKGVSLPTAEFGQDFEKEGNGLRVIKFSNPDSEYPEDPEAKKIV